MRFCTVCLVFADYHQQLALAVAGQLPVCRLTGNLKIHFSGKHGQSGPAERQPPSSRWRTCACIAPLLESRRATRKATSDAWAFANRNVRADISIADTG